MEKDFAILIADLSGYTALTEAHGASMAADLIDRFLQMVEESLVGNCYLHERTGDEIMIVSEVPDHLLSTAVKLLNNSCKEEKFLLIHGGLHVGKLLKRNDGYFGSALNFTARIAAKAAAGTFWCSREFREAVKNVPDLLFENKGSFRFKNLAGEKEVFEIKAGKTEIFSIDPVCRMLLLSKANAMAHPDETGIFFCSQNCLEVYSAQKSPTISEA
ncbi:MAG TPA: hypothetical protein VF609_01720 [Flavisolibacter sp.]